MNNSWGKILLSLSSKYSSVNLLILIRVQMFQMGFVVAGVSLVAPLVCCIMIQGISRKKILLFSASLMSAAMIFLALLIHFQTDVQQVKLGSFILIFKLCIRYWEANTTELQVSKKWRQNMTSLE